MLAARVVESAEVEAWCKGLLQGLPAGCPRAVSRPLIERLAGSERKPAAIREAVAWCLKLGNEPFARELIEAIPEGERLPIDWINLGVALGGEGRFSEALEATEHAVQGADEHRPWVLNNVAWFRAHLRPEAPAEERVAWLAAVREAQRLLEAQRPQGWTTPMSYFIGTEAELLRLGGDLQGALAAVDRAVAVHSGIPYQLLIRSKVLAAMGRPTDARAAAEEALRKAHPESDQAAKATRLLATIA